MQYWIAATILLYGWKKFAFEEKDHLDWIIVSKEIKTHKMLIVKLSKLNAQKFSLNLDWYNSHDCYSYRNGNRWLDRQSLHLFMWKFYSIETNKSINKTNKIFKICIWIKKISIDLWKC